MTLWQKIPYLYIWTYGKTNTATQKLFDINQDQQQVSYRLQSISYAIEIARLVPFLSNEELQHSEGLVEKISTLLQENNKLLSNFSTASKELN